MSRTIPMPAADPDAAFAQLVGEIDRLVESPVDQTIIKFLVQNCLRTHRNFARNEVLDAVAAQYGIRNVRPS